MDICLKKQENCLSIGADVVLVANQKELKAARALIVLATAPDRGLLEGPVDGVIDIENTERKDHLHYRRGGLDQVLAKILAKEGKAYVVSIGHIRRAKKRVEYIGRVLQNSMIAAKYDVPIIFVGGENDLVTREDREAFFRGIGVPQEVVHKSRAAYDAWIKRAKHRASDTYISEGIRKA